MCFNTQCCHDKAVAHMTLAHKPKKEQNKWNKAN